MTEEYKNLLNEVLVGINSLYGYNRFERCEHRRLNVLIKTNDRDFGKAKIYEFHSYSKAYRFFKHRFKVLIDLIEFGRNVKNQKELILNQPKHLKTVWEVENG